MKKVILTFALVFSIFQLASAKNQVALKKKDSPVSCCEKRTEGGTKGTSSYTVIVVKTCATSDVSYQDAQARACAKAERLAELSLQIAMETNVAVTIGSGN